MIFSIQRYLEDSFDRRGLRDVDQYAVKLANLYARRRHEEADATFLKSLRRVRTAFYRNNPALARAPFEEELLRRLAGFGESASDLRSFDVGRSALC
jgi:hypothetical protein